MRMRVALMYKAKTFIFIFLGSWHLAEKPIRRGA
jgi:hypothetical protein